MKYEFIGWCHDEAKNQDKVWGVILLAENITGREHWSYNIINRYLVVWGRRGKKLQTQIREESSWHIKGKIYTKSKESDEKNEYTMINKEKLDEVYPEFQEDLEKTTAWALLKV